MKVVLGVIGSRGYTNYEDMCRYMNDTIAANSWEVIKIVSGGAKGADSLARRYAKEHNIELVEYIPDWDTYGKRAGMIRNETIISNCDVVVAYWDYKSSGTAGALKLAESMNKQSHVYNISGIIETDIIRKNKLSSRTEQLANLGKQCTK